MADNFDTSVILASFLDEVGAYVPEIEANLDRLQQTPDDAQALEETYRRAHTIGGSAAMMDFAGLAGVAQGMERLLGDALEAQRPLDPATLALLRRSCGRVKRLLDQIRAGEDDAAIAAEDATDRAAWRGPSGATLASADDRAARGAGSAPQPPDGLASASERASSAPLDTGPMPRVPDWLAAFGGPTAAPGAQPLPGSGALTSRPGDAAPLTADGAFADSPAPSKLDQWATSLSQLPTGAQPAVTRSQPVTPSPEPQPARMPGPGERAPSFSDMLQAFQTPATPATGGGGSVASLASPSPSPSSTSAPLQPAPGWGISAPGAFDPAMIGTETLPTVPHPGPLGHAPAPAAAPAPAPAWPSWDDATPPPIPASAWQTGGLPHADAALAEPPSPAAVAAAGETHSLGLPVVNELRMQSDVVRRQVGALRDVVATLREAGQAMEDERAELRGFLDGSSDALERLEEWAGRQMGLDLRSSPTTVRRYLPLSVIWVTTTRLKKLVSLLHGSGRSLTATEEQIEESLDELRTAISGLGQISSMVAHLGGEPEQGFSATVAQVTYAPAPATAREELSPATRAELERRVREELRRELEDDVRDEVAAEVRREEEERLRHELSIQVRRQLLAELAPGLGATALAAQAQGIGQGLPQMPMAADRGPQAVQVTSEHLPEALDVFRDEAQEHLRTITAGITQLERAPEDHDALRSIRRAMHTLKGSAGMMGFPLVQDLAHASEDLLERLTDGTLTYTPAVLSLIFDTSEALDRLVSSNGAHDEDQTQVRDLVSRYARMTGAPIATMEPATVASASPMRVATADDEHDARDETTAEPGTPTTPDLSVRLQLSKLDELVTLFGELLINRSALEERVDRLNHLVGEGVRVSERLGEVGAQLETRFEAATLPSGGAGSLLPRLDGQAPAATNGWAQQPPRVPIASAGGTGALPLHAGEFDELELDRYTEFHRLSRGLSEGVADANTLGHEMESLIREIQTAFARESRLSSEFQDRLLKTRLVPVQSLVSRLYRATRASALKEGKEIGFFVEGGETEVDRKVIEEVEGPLLHLVRNAVNHGIERPEARERAGKPREGRVTIVATYEGNQVAITVRDDGAGVDPEHVRQTAVARGLLDPTAPLSEHDAINLIFQPGMTTASALTEESGRGVGLDVVRDAANRLRGTVEVDSAIGQGTAFTMKFPISLQIARAVLVKVGPQVLAVPMLVVGQIGRLDYYSRVPGPVPALAVRGEQYPLVHLASYLQLAPSPVSDRSPVLLINAGKQRVALLVDDILSQQEVVSKPLGPHLRDVPGVAGATVLGNGQVVLILELHELLALRPVVAPVLPAPGSQVAHSQVPTAPLSEMPASRWAAASETATRAALSASPAAASGVSASSPTAPFVVARSRATVSRPLGVPGAAHESSVLVVDDSPSVRRVVSNMLKAHGWAVQTARDGVEALEVIAHERPAAILLDIEMPRMDGYELMATVRSQEQYRALPLIVLTSRAAAKHQQRALQLGADAYIVKPYQDDDLLRTIASLVQARGEG